MLHTRIPNNLDITHSAFSYQLEAIESVKKLEYAALFHEQGLGKTKIALDLSLYWLAHDVVDSVLIVTKKSLVKNWKEEIAIHTKLSICVLDNNKKQNSRLYNRPFPLYLSHYEAIHGNKNGLDLFLRTRKLGVILDEAHRIKNPDGLVAKSLFELSSKFKRRVVMTGTPVANRPYDIWSQIYFLDQGNSLGTNYKEFKDAYDIPKNLVECNDSVYENNLQEVFHAIKSFTVRETKQTVGLDLPNKKFINLLVDMEAEQKNLYDKYKKDVYIEIFKNGAKEFDDVTNILKQMLRLVQVAAHPILVDQSYSQEPGKFCALSEVLSSTSDNEKVIVWTNFIQNVNYLSKFLSNWGSLKIHGKMAIEDRNKSIERFKSDPSRRVLVATPGAAKEGLTLTVANYAIFYDRNFSLNDWLQAQDRIHRISQVQPCFIIHLLAKNSIDIWVDSLLLYKQRLANLVLHDDLSAENQVLYNDKISSIIRKVLS